MFASMVGAGGANLHPVVSAQRVDRAFVVVDRRSLGAATGH